MVHVLTVQVARRVTSAAIAVVTALCLALGIAYTALIPAKEALPKALQALVSLPWFERFGSSSIAIPGFIWIVAGMLGVAALIWWRKSRTLERTWWFTALAAFGFWGGMYAGGIISVDPRSWVSAALFFLIGGLVAVVWWLSGLVRAMANALAAREHRHQTRGDEETQ